MKKSFEQRFPDEQGWYRVKFNLLPGHTMTEEKVKKIFMRDKNEADYEIGHLSIGKTVARFIFRKKQ